MLCCLMLKTIICHNPLLIILIYIAQTDLPINSLYEAIRRFDKEA